MPRTRAKKSLGQHFLRSEKAVISIIDAADVTPEDAVLEIGPGEGVLTEKLLFFAAKVIAVEKDRGLYELLKEKFGGEIERGRLDLVHGDILDFNPNLLEFYKDFDYKIVANIPYYITGAILKKFLSAAYQPERMVLLVQKEVAERIVAKKSKPLDSARGKESMLSISVKAYGTPLIAGRVPRGAFSPAPKVDSAILLIKNISRTRFTKTDERRFFALVRAGFAHKRKVLARNLSLDEKKLVRCGITPRARAEDLCLEDWDCLAAAAAPSTRRNPRRA